MFQNVQEIKWRGISGDLEPGKTAVLDIESTSGLPLKVYSSNNKIATVDYIEDTQQWLVSFLKEGTVSIKAECSSGILTGADGAELFFREAIPVTRTLVIKSKNNFNLNSASCPKKISSWKQMRDYIKVALGAGVICIEMTDAQIDIAITEALQIVQRYLYGEGHREKFIIIDLKQGQGEYVIDADILSVVAILNKGILMNTDNFRWNDLMNGLIFSNQGFAGGRDGGQGIIANWETQMAYIKTIEEQFGHTYQGQFDPGNKVLTVHPIPRQDFTAAMHCYVAEDCHGLFNNILFKKYATALAGIQWSRNLLKYASVQLPGGANVSASEIASQYQEMEKTYLEKIEKEGIYSTLSIG